MISTDNNSVSNFQKVPKEVCDIPTKILYINWSRRVKKDYFTKVILHQLMSSYGEVESICLGEGSRRTAVVTFKYESEAELARISLGEKPCELINGHVLHIEFAVDRNFHQEMCNYLRVPNVITFDQEEVELSSLVPGLYLYQEFISKEKEDKLISYLDSTKDEINTLNTSNKGTSSKWVDTVKTRQVQHFGYEFNYKTRRCDASQPLGEIPSIFDDLIDQISTKEFKEKADQITANEYLPGQGIAAHIDTHSAFTDAIASLSLGSNTVMEFRHPNGNNHNFVLPKRSLIIMTGESRYLWTHCISPRNFDILNGIKVERNRRISITFRKLSSTFDCNCDFKEVCDRHLELEENEEEKSLAPTELEKKHVHEFYETIAYHFSSTRYAPWPRVASYLDQLPKGSLVADLGCGNGKYMKYSAKHCILLGCDRSKSLVKICNDSELNVIISEVLKVPFRSNLFDAVISIAVLHHLSTFHHRLAAIQEVLRLVKVGGTGLIYAWAQEQDEESRRHFEDGKQDVFVPWTLDSRFTSKDSSELKVQRYCHLYRQGELEKLISRIENVVIEETYYDASNWCIKLRRIS